MANALGAPARADTHVGMMVDAGMPSGISGALALQASASLRLHVGVGHNMLGPGVRGGALLRLWRGTVAPTISAEAGWYGRTDAAWLTEAVDATDGDAALEQVGYTYGAAHAGVEIAGKDATFYAEMGAARIHGDLYFRETSQTGDVTMAIATESSLRFWTLSGRAGVLVWF